MRAKIIIGNPLGLDLYKRSWQWPWHNTGVPTHPKCPGILQMHEVWKATARKMKEQNLQKNRYETLQTFLVDAIFHPVGSVFITTSSNYH